MAGVLVVPPMPAVLALVQRRLMWIRLGLGVAHPMVGVRTRVVGMAVGVHRDLLGAEMGTC